MTFYSDKTVGKARILEQKGDHLRERGKWRKAMDKYQAALELDPSRLELYDKLLATHDEMKDDWTEEDFAFNVVLVMQRQEIEDPTFKRLNARLEPEFAEVTKLLAQMLQAQGREVETAVVESIAGYGESALYPLLDFILRFKEHSTPDVVSQLIRRLSDTDTHVEPQEN